MYESLQKVRKLDETAHRPKSSLQPSIGAGFSIDAVDGVQDGFERHTSNANSRYISSPSSIIRHLRSIPLPHNSGSQLTTTLRQELNGNNKTTLIPSHIQKKLFRDD